jgi:GDPmannose 4,6-dehydratase
VDEKAVVEAVDDKAAGAVKPGDVPSCGRPALLPPGGGGDACSATRPRPSEKLGWVPEITAREMCAEMVAEDLKIAGGTRC